MYRSPRYFKAHYAWIDILLDLVNYYAHFSFMDRVYRLSILIQVYILISIVNLPCVVLVHFIHVLICQHYVLYYCYMHPVLCKGVTYAICYCLSRSVYAIMLFIIVRYRYYGYWFIDCYLCCHLMFKSVRTVLEKMLSSG